MDICFKRLSFKSANSYLPPQPGVSPTGSEAILIQLTQISIP